MCYVSTERDAIIRPLGLALVTPDKAKHFYSHGLRLIRADLFYTDGLGQPDKAEYADGPVSQEAFEAERCHCRVLRGETGLSVISRLLSLTLN